MIILVCIAGIGLLIASVDFTQETLRKTETINPGYAWSITAMKANGDPIRSGDRLTITATSETGGKFDAHLVVQPNSGRNELGPFADFQAMITNFGVNTTKDCSSVTFEFTAQRDRDIPILLVHNKNNTSALSITVVVSAPGTGFSSEKLKANVGYVIGVVIIIGCLGWLASNYSSGSRGSEASMDQRIQDGLGKSSSHDSASQAGSKAKARFGWKKDQFGNVKGIDKN